MNNNPVEELFEAAEKANVKFVWTCNEHDECKTCEYFYFSCNGLTNSSDPRVKNIPEDLLQFIDISWRNLNQSHHKYVYWLRMKNYLELNLDNYAHFTLEEIKEFIKKKYGDIYVQNKKK